MADTLKVVIEQNTDAGAGSRLTYEVFGLDNKTGNAANFSLTESVLATVKQWAVAKGGSVVPTK